MSTFIFDSHRDSAALAGIYLAPIIVYMQNLWYYRTCIIHITNVDPEFHAMNLIVFALQFACGEDAITDTYTLIALVLMV